MKGYVRQRGDRYYAVIYEGRDPVPGRERRTWHPAGIVPGNAHIRMSIGGIRAANTRELCVAVSSAARRSPTAARSPGRAATEPGTSLLVGADASVNSLD